MKFEKDNNFATVNRGVLKTPASQIVDDPLVTAIYQTQLARGLSDQDIGEILGVGRTHWCSFRTGKRKLNSLSAARAAHKQLGIAATLLLS